MKTPGEMSTEELLAKATARPLSVNSSGVQIVTQEGIVIAECFQRGTETPNPKANAELIVRAVGSFEAMRGALELAKATIERLTTTHKGGFSSTLGTLDVITNALALADNQQPSPQAHIKAAGPSRPGSRSQ